MVPVADEAARSPSSRRRAGRGTRHASRRADASAGRARPQLPGGGGGARRRFFGRDGTMLRLDLLFAAAASCSTPTPAAADRHGRRVRPLVQTARRIDGTCSPSFESTARLARCSNSRADVRPAWRVGGVNCWPVREGARALALDVPARFPPLDWETWSRCGLPRGTRSDWSADEQQELATSCATRRRPRKFL